MVLDAITLKGLGAAVIHVDWEGDRNGALGEHEPITVVFIDLEIIRNDLELVASHLKNIVIVNTHRKLEKISSREKDSGWYLLRRGRAVKSKPNLAAGTLIGVFRGERKLLLTSRFALCYFATKFARHLEGGFLIGENETQDSDRNSSCSRWARH